MLKVLLNCQLGISWIFLNIQAANTALSGYFVPYKALWSPHKWLLVGKDKKKLCKCLFFLFSVGL